MGGANTAACAEKAAGCLPNIRDGVGSALSKVCELQQLRQESSGCQAAAGLGLEGGRAEQGAEVLAPVWRRGWRQWGQRASVRALRMRSMPASQPASQQTQQQLHAPHRSPGHDGGVLLQRGAGQQLDGDLRAQGSSSNMGERGWVRRRTPRCGAHTPLPPLHCTTPAGRLNHLNQLTFWPVYG